jgi:outer membrane beta-barrel protein
VRNAAWVVVLFLPSLALAQAEAPGSSKGVYAIQEREYSLDHEFTLGVGVLPLDPYYKGYAVQVGYTFHFSDSFAWQIGRFTYTCAVSQVCFDVDTSLKQQLLTQYGQAASDPHFAEVEWMAGSDLMWSPIYGKWTLLNRTVVHFEGFGVIGLSLVDLSNQGSGNLPIKPGLNVGLGMRVFYSKKVSFRIDLTDNVVLTSPTITNVPTIQLSVARGFGGTE